MRGVSLMLSLAAVLGIAVVPAGAQPPKLSDEDQRIIKDDEQLLAKQRLPSDGKGLLQYFRDRTYAEANPKLLAKLVMQLGSDNFLIREKAYKQIKSFGNSALFSLKKNQDHQDVETRTRVLQLLKQIEDNANPAVQQAVARLLAYRKPEGAATVMLAYLPFAARMLGDGVPLGPIAKPLIPLFHGQPGGRLWRRHLAERVHKKGAGLEVLESGLAIVVVAIILDRMLRQQRRGGAGAAKKA